MGLIHEHPELDDPHIDMRVVTVKFHDPTWNYSTNINGTRESVADYFRGARLNVASFPVEQMETPCCLEFPSDNGPTVSVIL